MSRRDRAGAVPELFVLNKRDRLEGGQLSPDVQAFLDRLSTGAEADSAPSPPPPTPHPLKKRRMPARFRFPPKTPPT